MNVKSSDVLKAIPDFEDFIKLSEEISSLMYKKMSLEADIRTKESNVFKTATTDERFFQNGRPPSTSYIESTYKHTGFDGEIVPLRIQLAEIVAELDKRRIQLDIYKSMIDIWRTLSSSERSSNL